MLTNLLSLGIYTVTAYCNPAHNVCANGHLPIQGTTIAGPRNLPFGTRVMFSDITNIFIVSDRLNKRFSNTRFDVFFDNKKDCVKWGKKQVKVYIIK